MVEVDKKDEVTNVKILHEKCERSKAQDKKLPTDSYLVTYKVENEVKYDISRAGCLVDVFDYYYDTYGKDSVMGITWSGGVVNPKTFDNANEPEKPKKRRRKKE